MIEIRPKLNLEEYEEAMQEIAENYSSFVPPPMPEELSEISRFYPFRSILTQVKDSMMALPVQFQPSARDSYVEKVPVAVTDASNVLRETLYIPLEQLQIAKEIKLMQLLDVPLDSDMVSLNVFSRIVNHTENDPPKSPDRSDSYQQVRQRQELFDQFIVSSSLANFVRIEIFPRFLLIS